MVRVVKFAQSLDGGADHSCFAGFTLGHDFFVMAASAVENARHLVLCSLFAFEAFLTNPASELLHVVELASEGSVCALRDLFLANTAYAVTCH